MDELTIEQKAKAYDGAIKRAEKWRNAPNVDKIRKPNLINLSLRLLGMRRLSDGQNQKQRGLDMTIRKYNRAYLPCDPLIAFRRFHCFCSNPPCGIKTPRTTGFAIYFLKYSIYINFSRPKGCNAPF